MPLVTTHHGWLLCFVKGLSARNGLAFKLRLVILLKITNRSNQNANRLSCPEISFSSRCPVFDQKMEFRGQEPSLFWSRLSLRHGGSRTTLPASIPCRMLLGATRLDPCLEFFVAHRTARPIRIVAASPRPFHIRHRVLSETFSSFPACRLSIRSPLSLGRFLATEDGMLRGMETSLSLLVHDGGIGKRLSQQCDQGCHGVLVERDPICN